MMTSFFARLAAFIEAQPRSRVLFVSALLLVGGHHRWEETGKVFEYLAAGKPILAVVHPGGAAAELLHSGLPFVVVDQDPERTERAMLEGMLAVAADRFPHGGASMFGVLAASGNFGCTFMPWVIGVAADHWAINWGLSTATLCPLGLALLLLWMRRQAGAAPVRV